MIRAVGVKAASCQDEELQSQIRAWLLELLDDSSEKVRRYATNALPRESGGDCLVGAMPFPSWRSGCSLYDNTCAFISK